MPAFYAHNMFGNLVLDALPSPLQDAIHAYPVAFMLGTQGPDILFYHKPFSSNAIKTKGMSLHTQSALGFFKRCHEQLKTLSQESSPMMSYVAGFICHFMLDNACHPYVYQLEDTGVAHGLIESEFDKYCKRQAGVKVHTNAAKALTHGQGTAWASATILDVDEQAVRRAIKSMRTINGLFSSSSRAFHAFASKVLKLVKAEKFACMFLHFTNNAACDELNPVLYAQLQGAVAPTAALITTYFESLNNAKKQDFWAIFDKDYKGEKL